MTRWTVVAVCVVAAVAGSPAIASAQAAGKPATRPASVHSWWNDETIATDLALTAEQRRKMDAAYQSHADTAGRAVPRDTRLEFYAALEAGEWNLARKQLSGVPATLPNPVRPMLEMKLAVVQLLTDEQRQALMARHPDLLRRRWEPRAQWTDADVRGRRNPAQRPGE
jgi:Spy/CpxP family protein refolding chaperone